MRILMLTQFYPPIIGGEERHVVTLSNALAARGHDVSVATLRHQNLPEMEVERGVRLHRVRGSMQRLGMLFSEESRQYAPPFPDPEVLARLRRIIQDERPDIVHAHNWIIHSFTPLKAWSKARLIMTLHDYSLICVQKRLMHRGVPCTGPGFTKCLGCAAEFYGVAKGLPTVLAHAFWAGRERRAVDMFLPVSQAVVEGAQLDKYQVPYRIIPNFIPDQIDMVNDDTNPLFAQLPKGDFLLFVGDVTPDKGAEVLLQAYAELDTQVPLVLIGRPLLSNLAERFPQRVLRNVLLLGPQPHDVVMAAWNRCTIGLVPSIVAETFGIVALEAMRMGKPVIATRTGGLTDVIVDEETGLLVPPGDAQALRAAIQSLLDDPARRASMGDMARQRVAKFQETAVVSQIEQVYQELLGMSAPDDERSQALVRSK